MHRHPSRLLGWRCSLPGMSVGRRVCQQAREAATAQMGRPSAYPRGHWEQKENRTAFMQEFAASRSIRKAEEWKAVSVSEVCAAGGKGMLKHHHGSLFRAVQEAFPQLDVKDVLDVRPRLPAGHWEVAENRRAFMDQVAVQLGVEKPEDWAKVSVKQVQAFGGSLLRRYSHSLRALLQDVYPEMDWATCGSGMVTSRGFWSSDANRRAFMDKVAAAHGVEKAEDWRRVKYQDIKDMGGSRLLQIFNNSVFATLQAVYPEQELSEWECRTKLPQGFWKSQENRKKLMDRVAKKFKVTTPEEWSRVTVEDVRLMGGGGMFNHYASMLEALRDIYPEQAAQFTQLSCRQSVPAKYWDEETNVRDFLEEVKKQLGLETNEDWMRVGVEQLRRLGGRGLLARMPLVEALQLAYPTCNWKFLEGQKAKKTGQLQMRVCARRLLGKQWDYEEDYWHKDLSSLSDTGRVARALELDLYFPQHKLAFEYNGAQHYHDIPFFGAIEVYRARDEEKQELCKRNGIRLVVVPYWWDNRIETLAGHIQEQFPSLLSTVHAAAGEDSEKEVSELVARAEKGKCPSIPSAPARPEAPPTYTSGSDGLLGLERNADPTGLWLTQRLFGRQLRYSEEDGLSDVDGVRIPSPGDWRKDMPSEEIMGVLVK